jgi:hypothetical protein
MAYFVVKGIIEEHVTKYVKAKNKKQALQEVEKSYETFSFIEAKEISEDKFKENIK